MNIADRIGLLLEYDSGAVDAAYQKAIGIHDNIAAVKNRLRMLNSLMREAADHLCCELAVAVRRVQPSLYVSIDKNGCKIGYKKKYLSLFPDIEHKVWIVTSSNDDFLSRFSRSYSLEMGLNEPVSKIAENICTHFRNFYKSLNEELEGEGHIIISESETTMRQLVQHVLEARQNSISIDGELHESH